MQLPTLKAQIHFITRWKESAAWKRPGEEEKLFSCSFTMCSEMGAQGFFPLRRLKSSTLCNKNPSTNKMFSSLGTFMLVYKFFYFFYFLKYSAFCNKSLKCKVSGQNSQLLLKVTLHLKCSQIFKLLMVCSAFYISFFTRAILVL